jgi:hypothetical protein
MAAFPRVYRSFDEFQREELRKLDSLHTTVDDMLEEKFSEELDFSGDKDDKPRRRRGRPRKNSY